MRPSGKFMLPYWLAPFCCVVPFLVLMLFSIALVSGVPMSGFFLVASLALCGKVIRWVLDAVTPA